MVYKKTVNCNTSNLGMLRHFVSGVLYERQVPANLVNMIVLAVDEVCANRMIHSNQENHEEAIEVSIRPGRNENEVLIEIKDQGDCFDIASYCVPNMTEVVKQRKTGGMGLILVKKIIDHIQVYKDGNTNICQLYKKL
ncbi:ATP-binding protein [Limibacter armeniacum]|uniref:ATP-binding protein n=1 Tax=Limibacter armeniacum TaxID=466084 RepID=UPI002FE579D4